MRRITYPVLTLVLVLSACTGLLIFRQSWWPEVSARVSDVVGRSGPKDSANRISPFAEPKKDVASKPVAVAARPGPPREPGITPPTSQTQAEVTYPFPDASEISSGDSKSSILAVFGPAEVMVTGADLGQLNERLVYRDKLTGKRTVISTVNGRVSGAQTYLQ